MSKTSQRKLSLYQMGREDARRLFGPRWKRHPMKGLYMRGYMQERRKLQREDGFDWVHEQQRQIRRQEIKDAVVGGLLGLMVIGGAAVATGVIGG